MSKLIILAGIPGSGKTTWANTFFDLKYKLVSPDDIRMREYGSLVAAWQGDTQAKNQRVFTVFHRDIQDALEHGVDVIADATHLTRRGRHELRKLAHGVPGSTHLVVFKNVVEGVERNAARTEDIRVPDEAQSNMIDGYFNLLHDLREGERGLYDTVTMIESFA